MEFGLLSDDVIQEILTTAMETHFSRSRPATRYFFEHQRPPPGQERTLTIHHWAIAEVTQHDNRSIIKNLANQIVKEVAKTATKITGELIFRTDQLLPHQPLWEDGSPLFAAHTEEGHDRFGLPGGNIVESSGCHAEDVQNAAHVLQLMDTEFDPDDERLLLFCAKPLEKKLIRAAAKASIPCRVFGLYNHKNDRSWVLTRDTSPCSLLIGQPTHSLPVKGNKLVAGARFTVWIDDPKNAVCVTP